VFLAHLLSNGIYPSSICVSPHLEPGERWALHIFTEDPIHLAGFPSFYAAWEFAVCSGLDPLNDRGVPERNHIATKINQSPEPDTEVQLSLL
jgi:hypothetical protein